MYVTYPALTFRNKALFRLGNMFNHLDLALRLAMMGILSLPVWLIES